MLTLTTPIAIPNIQKIRVDSVQLDGNVNVGTIVCSIIAGGGNVYLSVQIQVHDGLSQGIRATASPVGLVDRVETFSLATPTGFTDLVAASVGGISLRNKAAESMLLAAGLLPAGAVA